MYKIGWFTSGKDEAARNLLNKIHEAIHNNYIKNTKIAFLFINSNYGEFKESDRFIDLAHQYNIPVISLSHRKFKPSLREKGLKEKRLLKYDPPNLVKWRIEYDEKIIDLLKIFTVDLIVLAGYMLICSNRLVEKQSLINLHPAFPGGPQGTWQQVIWELIKTGSKKAGCMIHLVTEELDKGPPITYCDFSIVGPEFDKLWKDLTIKRQKKTLGDITMIENEMNPLFQKIREKEFEREIPLLIETIRKFSERKFMIKNRMIYCNGKRIKKGCNLTESVENYIGKCK